MRVLVLMSLLLAANAAWSQVSAEYYSWYDDDTGEVGDAQIRDMETGIIERRSHRDQAAGAEDQARVGALQSGLNVTLWGIGTAVAGRELYDNWRALGDDEAACGGAYVDEAAPVVPSSCAENSACMECFAEAVRRVDFNRRYIERAHCITASAVRMANSAMAFGDSTSGIHGVAGLSWQRQGKPQIEASVKQIRNTYTVKAGQYLQGLESSLRKLGECEAEHNKVPDWYQRYGWVYVSFMQSRYQSPP